MAPIPMNNNNGIASLASIPVSKSHWIIPLVSPTPALNWSTTPDRGRFTKIAPNPIGISRAGSNPFSTASQMSSPPMAYITSCCHVMDRTPCQRNEKSIILHSFFVRSVFGDLYKKDLRPEKLERRSGHFRHSQSSLADCTCLLTGAAHHNGCADYSPLLYEG